MVFFGGAVVGFGGGELIFEVSEKLSGAVGLYLGEPFSFCSAPGDASVFRVCAGLFCEGLVAVVLGWSCGSEVCFAVVEAVVVYVVADHVLGDVDNLVMHPYSLSGVLGREALPACGV